MTKKTRGISGVLLGLVVGGVLFSQVPQSQSTVTDSVVQPASGQTAVQLDTAGKGHVAVKTQTTTSQAGKTVSRQTTTMTQGHRQQDMHK
ncbi:MAG: hypothetical protein LKH74_10715 [Levilactobacillus sp.]|jgi:hypothetical protein|uniref:hypothetical protein n=1 Tax=Levilactobacillus sp. TaxID=2767919 RepID=UPI00258C19F6|nr:hypothetical protein [Levilactobacillus sp.]MCI1554380.1 hypothetical protein [Levilactobacillus sp.]MCI1598289.1 hypothetical protein [Levilactobacillus sp.]MCI1605336.1 hypothetical protein [Levilactobacillus sp.]